MRARILLPAALLLLALASPLAAAVGDLDSDSDIDVDDIAIILAAVNTPAAGPADPKDLDSDGTITALDARIAVTCCTRPLCATGNNPPTIADQAFSVDENSANSTSVGTVVASDPDAGQSLSFAITGGNTGGAFAINAATGEITVANSAALDFETTPSFALTVEVTDDDASPLSSSATVTINLNDVNEAPSITSAAAVNAAENQTAAADVQSTDPDGETEGGGGLTYSLTGGADQGAFSIDPNSGVLTFNAAPDFETPTDANADNVYEVQVTVTDSGTLTDVQDLQVTVTNVNEAPSITSAAAVNAAESQTAAADVQSTDPDGETEGGGGLTYSLTGGADQGAFSIDPNSGVLTFNAAPDFETPTDANADNVYEVQVTVTDAGLLTGVQDLQVTVTDVNEPPTITAIADQVTPEDVATGALAFTIDDPETAAGSLIVTASSSNQTIIPDGNLTLGGAAPNLTIDVLPAANQFGGPVTITVTVDDGSTSTPETFGVTVTSVNDLPVGVVDSFDFIGNTQLRVDLAPLPGVPAVGVSTLGGVTPLADGVLDNDSDPVEGSAISVSGVRDGAVDCADATPPFTDCPTANGGRVTMEANGQFSYVPAPGDPMPADFFQYRLFDGTDNVIVGVTLNRFARVWYVDNGNLTPPSPIKGTSADPFSTLAAAEIASLAGDTIFVHEGDGTTTGQDAGIRLKPDQRLIGEGIDLTVNVGVNGSPAPTLVFDSVANNRPLVEHAAAASDGVTVLADLVSHNNVEIRGLDLTGTRNAIRVESALANDVSVTIDDNAVSGAGNEGVLVSHPGSGRMTVTVRNTTIAVTGNAFDASTSGAGDLELAFDGNTGLTSAAAAGAAIHVEDAAGAGSLFVTSFSNNEVLGTSSGDGVRVLGAIFDGNPADPDFDPVAGGTLTVGAVADRVPRGVTLGTPANRVRGNLSFGTLNVFTFNGAALTVSGTGVSMGGPPPTAGLLLAIAGGTSDAINGPAVAFDPLTSNVVLNNISSATSSGAGVSLNTVSGSFSVAMGGIVNSTGPAFEIIGGTVTSTYSGNIGQASNAPAVSVTGGHNTGTVTFQTGMILVTGGNGLQFDNADGTYQFTGTTTLNGGDAGIDVLNGSDGAFSFGSSTAITSPTGPAFNLVGGTASVTYSGNVTQANNAPAVSVSGGHTTGTVTFQTGTINATGGTGLQFNNADSVTSYNFTGTTTLNGGDAGIDIVNGSAGSFSFGSSTAITNPSGTAFNVNGGNGTIIYSGSIANNANRAVEVTNRNGGTITFQTGTITDTGGTGIRAASNSAGTLSFNGNVDVTNSTGAAVIVESNTGGTTSFANLDVDNSTSNQPGIFATANGGVHTLNTTTGTVDAGSGTAIDVDNTILGMTLVSVDSSGGSVPGIDLLNTTGSFTVGTNAGGEVVGDGGTIMHASGNNDAVLVNNATNVTLRNMLIDASGRHGIHLIGSSGFTLANSRVEDAGNADNEHGLFFEDVTGTHTIDGSTVTRAANDLFRIESSNANATINVQNGSLFADTDGTGPLFGNDAILLAVQGTSIVTLNVNDSFFDAIFGNAVQVGNSIEGTILTATGTVNFNANNNMMTANPADLNKGTNFVVSGQDSVTVNVDWTNNTFTGTKGPGTLQVDANDSSTVQGHIGRAGMGNTLNDTNTEAIGLFLDESAKVTLIVEANAINTSQSDGIQIANFGGASPGPADLDVTLKDNTIDMHNQGGGFVAGVSIFGTGAAGGGTCVKFDGNTITNTPGGFDDYFIDDFGDPNPLLIEGPGMAAVTCSDIETLNGQVGLSCSIGGTVTFSNGVACDTPP